MMNTVFALLKKDLRLNQILLLIVWFLSVCSITFELRSLLGDHGYTYISSVLPIFAYAFTASVFIQDSSSDIHAFWRMQPISALQVLIAKFLLVFIFIVLPVVAAHWLSLRRLPITLNHLHVVEPLAWLTMITLAIGLLGAVVNTSQKKFIAIYFGGFYFLAALYFWASISFQIDIPSYQGTESIFILMSAIILLLLAHWACYLRREFKFQISIVTFTLLTVWCASIISGAWFSKAYRPQPSEVLGIDNLTSQQVSLYRNESRAFDESTTTLYAKINLSKHVSENFILSSQSQLVGVKSYDITNNVYHTYLDRGVFSLAHTKFGFAKNKDREFENALVKLVSIKQADWIKASQSPTDANVHINFTQPQINPVADIPFNSGADIIFRDQLLRINTDFFSNSQFVISLKGITREALTIGVILYNPILKEIVLTQKYNGSAGSLNTYLSQPKLRNLSIEWQASNWRFSKSISRASSTGYTVITKQPTKEWFEDARIKVYATDLSKPVIKTLKFEGIDLTDIPLVEQSFN